jgi:hypothetical protein
VGGLPPAREGGRAVILRANKPKWHNGLSILVGTFEGVMRWITDNVPHSPARSRLIAAVKTARTEALEILK